jgi:hypothetical protein
MPNERRRMVTSAMNNASPSDVLKKTFWPAEVVAEEVEEEGQDFHVAVRPPRLRDDLIG